jgi:hypothetical protein
MMADNDRLTDRLRELELALAVVEQECMRYQTLYHDTKKALDTLRAVRTQRVQDVAQAVAQAVREEREKTWQIAAALIWASGGHVFVPDSRFVTLRPEDEIIEWHDPAEHGMHYEIRARRPQEA